MNTGLEKWAGLADLGAVYPMIGTEGVLVILGVAYWLVWQVLMTKRETKKLQEQAEKFRK